MFEPMYPDQQYASVIVMDGALVEEYQQYLEGLGQRVDVVRMTRKRFHEIILAGYLHENGMLN